ncbi:MAG: prolipoprotein diacylglyceryl transferase [Chitinophagaceae bacterium]|nr:prolipoprotein diacylglyceryl transferase [Chitinophagaceae bacterium]
MYPNLYYAFKDLFGVEWTWLRFINSFGFFVALAFIAAAFILTLELKRKEREGLLHAEDVRIVVGKPAGVGELLTNFLLGFLLGFKILGLFLSDSTLKDDPQQFIFSAEGSWPAGIILGLLFAGLKWREKNKQKLTKTEERTIRIWPHDRVGDIVIYAALFGFLGAKLFHNFENWSEFVKDPIQALLSFSGLTFYGGLILAALAIFWYARKHGISLKHLCDSAAPALMLAYAIGRIGCQVSGDGDWGILNSAYITTPTSKVEMIDSTRFKVALQNNAVYYTSQFAITNPLDAPHRTVKAPSWLPDWTVAYAYPQNVIGEGTQIEGCKGQYCAHLPIPVFPTPFYETVACTLLFLLLWSLRTRLTTPGTMFAVYLIVNGIERFFIEKIRVNTKYDIFGWHPTQAELISSLLVLTGISLFIYLKRKKLS